MSSQHRLPARGSNITVLITRIHSSLHSPLVEFWGSLNQVKTLDYQSLSPVNPFQELEGNPGDLCLVQINHTWYRSRIVSRNGSNCKVFLIDKGITFSTTTKLLAWGKRELFHLPPEVEFCVLANVLPLSPENRWSPIALEFLKSFGGQTMNAHVQDVLVQQRKLLLDIPCISRQMYEMGLAKKLDSGLFLDYVLKALKANSGAEMFPAAQQIPTGVVEQLHKKTLYMYPELLTGAVETVVVTEVTNPQRVFCQLKVFSQELKKLSEQITQRCSGRMASCSVGPEMIGFPCAARGSDGRWYRSVLQQVLQANNLVEVLNVDYGTKQFVQIENVRPLAPEFFRMPVVTYVCSLHGIIDKGVGWTSTQIDYLKTLLLHKTLIVKFEYQSISEGVYYVTLYGDENKNLNNLFTSKESSLQENEKTLDDYAIGNTTYSSQHPSQLENNGGTMLPAGQALGEDESQERTNKFPVENLRHSSPHVAYVAHVSNPSEFWIQTENYAKELDELMDNMHHFYKHLDNKDVMENPAVGTYCAAKADDGVFYRAVVSEVVKAKIKVFFVDYGDTKEVDGSNIRTLPDTFKRLPQLAVKCSLAGVGPKEKKWSYCAIEFFIKIATDKPLKVHVMAKQGDSYLVTLTDPEAAGEGDLSQLLCSSGLAERDAKPPKIFKQQSEAGTLGVYQTSVASFQTQDIIDTSSKEKQTGMFKENMFPIGSVLDVNVSYIDSPNDFWCQLAQNSGHLKLLMHDIQAHYAGSEFEPLTEASCVARHPDNGMWYRALVIYKHKTPQVDVLFVDYGQTKTVSLHDLRRICPEFLKLHGQAFRCSLFNPLDESMSVVNDWNEEAKETFHTFVETAASNLLTLKCTLYAVMYNEQMIVFNIVDLETPFESICTSMANLTRSPPAKKDAGSSFRLDTYYYSTHNIKTGTEEQVMVTCVDSVGQFYCQLDRNADVIKDLKMKVNDLCHHLADVKPPSIFGTLCFAKYTDGLWYRAQLKATKPAVVVHFVDYGDTTEVAKSDLLPVPKEAYDIMSVPVQAVVCRLSDVPAVVPSEANCWFAKMATECKFRALIVAKEPNGSLLVELYHRNIQINSKVKKIFQIEMQTEGKPLYEGRKVQSPIANKDAVPKVPSSKEAMPSPPKTIQKHVPEPKPAQQVTDQTQTSKCNSQNGQKMKAASQELYLPPHQRQHYDKQMTNTTKKENVLVTNNSKLDCTSPSKESDSVLPQAQNPKRPKLEDFPKNLIPSGMEADVYVSHYNSPSSFYVQLAKEEDEIFSLVDKLNDSLSTPKIRIAEVYAGDVVKAEFEDDCLWYRAAVIEVLSNSMALVEFVDFGNTAQLSISKMADLDQEFVQLPRYSIHCMLSDSGSFELLDAEALKRDIGSNAEKKLKCQFVRPSGDVWEVGLVDNGVQVRCKASTRCPGITTDFEQEVEKAAQSSETSPNSCSLRYHHMHFKEGQQLEVYISTVCDAQTFWCQSVDSVVLDKICESLSGIGTSASHKPASMSTLSPGTPCIALFAEEQLWCRAEVLNKAGGELSVLFVDYGNTSQVTDSDVREITTDLLETPPQAFLCQLEGFDVCLGSWCNSAADELVLVTADKSLQMTITKISSKDGKNTCFVRLECEGLVINETMKRWWVNSTPEDSQSTLDETLQSTDSTAEASEDEGRGREDKGIDVAGAHADVDLHLAVTSTPKSSVDNLHASVLSPESPPGELHLPERPSSNKGVINIVPTPVMPCIESNVLHSDSGLEENTLPIQNIAANLEESDTNYEEQSTSVTETSWLEESRQESTDDSGIQTSPSEVDTHSMRASSEVLTYSAAPHTASDDCRLGNSRPVTSGKAVKMVPRDAVSICSAPHPTVAVTSEDSGQAAVECLLPSLVHGAQELHDTSELQNEAEDVIPQQEDADVVILLEEMNDMTTNDDAFELSEEDTHLDVSLDSRHTCTVTSTDTDTLPEEVMHLFELTDPTGQSDEGVTAASNDCCITVAGEEMCNAMTEEDTSDLHVDEHPALSIHTAHHSHTLPLPEEDSVMEEVTCLVRDLCLTDIDADEEENRTAMPDQKCEDEMEDSEHTKDSKAGVFVDLLSSDDDGLDVLPPNVIHLSLVIHDGADDTQQPEDSTC
ncbi:tudor domain-containing 6 isoform X2 [Dunckerocampus dactyliophorus]|uniref:tudor domain-containing 6 isoform X2 n=1 Tax=Dunckerocampus dactyliophorus TaxID=161453 RepID=UPI0024056F58|nr:tudor domain-containing 6 isoform X2 [Dunckerocampus dactyliophorus]